MRRRLIMWWCAALAYGPSFASAQICAPPENPSGQTCYIGGFNFLTVASPYVNNGSIYMASFGQINATGATFTNNGSLNGLPFSHVNLQNATLINAGAWNHSSGSFMFNSSILNTGSIWVDGGTVTLFSNSSIANRNAYTSVGDAGLLVMGAGSRFENYGNFDLVSGGVVVSAGRFSNDGLVNTCFRSSAASLST